MDFDANSLLASLLVSSVGFVLFYFGRRMRRVPHLAVGLALMIFPYFVGGVWLMFGIAAALLVLLWLAVQRGF
ncbi:MAG: hypothetical protein QM756_03790 [Polyangiaceae bacterium]